MLRISDKLNKKNRLVKMVISAFLILAIAIPTIIWIGKAGGNPTYEELKDQQSEMLQTLKDRVGDYDESTIVLAGTSEREAKDLAEMFDAKLRITSDGNFATLTLPTGVTITDIVSNEENLSYLNRLSINWSAQISDVEEDSYTREPSEPKVQVSDTLYSYQSYLNYLNLDDVWNGYRGNGITIAVIDTGIDTDHIEFNGRISQYSYNASEDKIVKDCLMQDGSYDWSIIEDEQGHGTAVAGTIGAAMDGNGTVGIAPEVTILVIKAECDESGNFLRSSDLVFGLYYAIERDVDVINMSFGSLINIYEDAARLGRDSDILMVAAAGNFGTAALMYPAADENVIGVGALADDSWELAMYSNYGENTDVVAPGTVYTTLIDGEYGIMNGTSFSSPIVAATLGLLKTHHKYRYSTNADIIEALYASAYDLGDLGPDYYFGYGAIDVDALIFGARGTVTFDYLTDEIDETKQIFVSGNPLQSIPEPERLYSIFDGWYYDIECTEPLELYRDAFSSDLTLYAGWINEDDGIPYTYVILDDGTVEIRSYTGHRKYITIPETIENRKVSSIGDFAFANQTKLRDISLPNSINHIGISAFEGCSNLITVNIPDNVTEIKENAFKDDIRLSYIVIGTNSKLKTVGDFAFEGCSKLKTIDLPKMVESINGSAFYKTLSLTKINVDKNNAHYISVSGALFNKSKTEIVAYPAAISTPYTLPDATRSVGIYAFNCSNATQIDLNKAEIINNYAFCNSDIKEIHIIDSITYIGSYAFFGCPNLSSVEIGSGLSAISSYAFAYTSSLKSISIPENIMTIDSGAFANSRIEEIEFKENGNLAVIGSEAFTWSSLREIDIPNSLISIGLGAFSECHNLTKASFDQNSTLQAIGGEAFFRTLALAEITLPKTVRIIGDGAFDSSAIAGVISISENLEYLGAGAFASCKNLTDFKVADNNKIYTDESGVVYTKDRKTIVAYPTGNQRTSYTLLSGTEVVGASSFEGSNNLTSIMVPEGVTKIMASAFSYCRYVSNYSLPTTLTEICEYSFSDNYSLIYIDIPDKVSAIGKYAFENDIALYQIRISDNSEMNRIGFAAFAKSGIHNFRIPANISSIAQYAFEGCDNLTNVTFAENSKLESISAYMFLGADRIQNINFENGSALTSIQAHGLEGMSYLRTIDFGDAKITNIDNYAFRYCSTLSSITLPDTVENIGRYAFYKCTSLGDISIPVATEHIGSYAFYGTENCNLYFTSEYLPMYLDENWDNGLGGYYTGVMNIVTNGDWKYATKSNGNIAIIEYLGSASVIDLSTLNLGSKIDTIGGYAFSGSNISKVTLPDSLIDIQRYAFAHTGQLKSVTIPKNVKYIAANAFMNSGIESLTFAGNNVEVIEKYAFAFTDNLKSVALPSSIKSAGSYIFYQSGLTSLSFAKGFTLTEIPESAFAGTKISSVIIPDSVTRIHSSAFRDNLNLTSVTLGSGSDLRIDANAFYNTGISTLYIPENLRYIGEYAFIGLESLKNYQVDKNNPNYTAIDGVLYSKDKTKLIAFPAGREGSFMVPSYVEAIGFGAFENSHLSKITFAKDINLLTLGWRAFYGAENITEITLPSSLISIDYYAFAGCKNLTTVSFAENNKLKGIYEGAFFGCQNLKSITIPDSIVEISDYAFYGCMSLTKLPVSDASGIKGIFDYAFAYTGIKELTIPSDVVDIGKYAFRGALLEKVYIPNSNSDTLQIGIGAFEDCTKITEITLPFIGEAIDITNQTWLGYIFGAGSYEANKTYVPEGLKTLTILDGVTTIPGYAFFGLDTIESISVPHSVVHIGQGAFHGTTAEYRLTNTISVDENIRRDYYYFGNGIQGDITLDDSMTEIYYYMFYNCGNIENIYMPDSITFIDSSAFAGCSSLKEISIPTSVTSIDSNVFSDCSSITSMYIPDGITEISHGMFSGCHSLESVRIPDSITSIGAHAFYECYKLEEIYIPDGVTEIGRSAFAYCSSVESLDIPDSVIKMGERQDWTEGSNIFYYCTSLKHVTLPKGLTAISDSMFYGCKSLEEFEIPDSVTYIGNYAFRECESLKNVVIPDGVTYIGRQAFYYCYDLASINIPGSVESIGEFTFRDCFSLAGVTLGYGIKEITDHAFVDCNSLSEITIPNSVTTIGYGAFSGCTSLRNVVLSNQLTRIGSFAFGSCYNITSITLPKTLTQIDDNAFYYCNSLKRITNNSRLDITFDATKHGGISTYASTIINADGTTRYLYAENGGNYYLSSDGFLFTTDNGIYTLVEYIGVNETVTLPKNVNGQEYVISGFSGATNVIIPEGIKKIGYEAFAHCKSLRSVTLPSSLEEIGGYAFYECSGLESINIPNGVTKIDGGAFRNCSKLTEITIPNGVTYVDNGLFYDCTSLEKVNLPSSIEHIFNEAFAYCFSLQEINLPEGLESIEYRAFYECKALESITLPSTIEYLYTGAFMNCSELASINLPNSLKVIDTSIFNGTKISDIAISPNHPRFTLQNNVLYSKDYSTMICVLYGATEIVLPSDMVDIPSCAFKNCTTVTKITIPSTVKTIGSEAFSFCTSLTEIVIPEGVKTIDYEAFLNCTSLSSITIPNSITYIGSHAFYNCTSLESAEIGNGLKYIPDYMFARCQSLERVKFRNDITSIGDGAFSYCASLERIDIPDTVTEIGIYAFECTSLKELKLPRSLTKIGSGMIETCSSIERIDIPDSVTEIGSSAFARCMNLKEINIGKNSKLTTIGWGAFQSTKITEINIPDTVKEIGDGAFAYSEIRQINISKNNPYFAVDNGILYNKSFTNIICAFNPGSHVALPNTITHIPDYSFMSQREIVYLYIPDSVKTIGREAFDGCDGIRVVRMGKNVESIDSFAFSSCVMLYKVINDSSLRFEFGSMDNGKIGEFARSIVDKNGNISYNPKYSGTTYIETTDGFLFELKNGEYTLTDYLGTKDTITLPKSINGSEYKIESFKGGSHVIIPDGFTVINSSAFYADSNLKSIRIPASVTMIDSNAFLYAKGLENIYIEGTITYVGTDVLSYTAYHDNHDNWEDGCLYLSTCIVDVKKDVEKVVIRPDTTAISYNVFSECYLLKDLTIGIENHEFLLAGLTNLETLTLTKIPNHSLIGSFGYDQSRVPLTLSKIILTSGCDIRDDNFFYGISQITIFVEDEKESCPWDNDYTGWNNGNKVVYGGNWYYVNYYDQDGRLISRSYYSKTEVIKPPYIYSYKDENSFFRFDGWDIDGDGVADGIPATINNNYNLVAVLTEVNASYTITYLDKDGVSVLYTYDLPYGASTPIPTNPTKKGYTFLGWSYIPETMTEDVVVYSNWSHNGGGHKYSEKVVAPTCTENGYTLHACSICGESYKSDITEMSGHSYTDWVVITDASCTADGIKRGKCSCGNTKNDVIDSYGHSYVEVNRAPSTCKNEGQVDYVCSECGGKLSESISTTNHKYTKKYSDKTQVEELANTLVNIIFGYEGDNGYYYECIECSKIATTSEDIFSGTAGIMSTCYHVLGEWVVLKQANCLDGYEARSCMLCDKVIEIVVLAATSEHNYENQVTSPTCTEQGYTTHICTSCSNSYKDSYKDATGHNYSENWTIDIKPGCTTSGSKCHLCLGCGDKKDVTKIPATGHSFTNYTTNNDATYTEDGTMSAVCDNCKATDTVVDVGSALGISKMFDDLVSEIVVNTSWGVSYEELCDALDIYNSLTNEEKANVGASYEILMNAINSYNNGENNNNSNNGNTPPIHNEEKSSALPAIIVVVVIVIIVALVIFFLKKKNSSASKSEKSVFDTMNGLTKAGYTKITVNVKTISGDEIKTAENTLTDSTVSMHFDENNFTDVVSSDGKFSARVVSPSKFITDLIDATDMSISVEYTALALTKVTIDYKTTTSKLTMVYTFRK